MANNPDIVVTSVPDGQRLRVRRDALQTSQVFRDMFLCCDSDSSGTEQVLDLHESAAVLIVLLKLLNSPPELPVLRPRDKLESFRDYGKRSYDASTIIPLPLLSVMMTLADKYALPTTTVECLGAHLEAHAQSDPLRVYGMATLHNLDSAASFASQFIAPLSSYEPHQVREIPTSEAYQKVLRLQAFRVKALQKLLLTEEIFPHGYRECPSHRQDTLNLWEETRRNLVWRIETLTDVAGEMECVKDSVAGCHICFKAAEAAVDMLRYKCRRVPRTISYLEEELSSDPSTSV